MITNQCSRVFLGEATRWCYDVPGPLECEGHLPGSCVPVPGVFILMGQSRTSSGPAASSFCTSPFSGAAHAHLEMWSHSVQFNRHFWDARYMLGCKLRDLSILESRGVVGPPSLWLLALVAERRPLLTLCAWQCFPISPGLSSFLCHVCRLPGRADKTSR